MRSTLMEIQVYRLLVSLALATLYPPWVSIPFADLLKPISLVHGACRSKKDQDPEFLALVRR